MYVISVSMSIRLWANMETKKDTRPPKFLHTIVQIDIEQNYFLGKNIYNYFQYIVNN